MSRPVSMRGQLERQLHELSTLRNAGTRSEEFRAWRQHTLTLLQRAWPDDSRPADRFKRIPFSPSTARADANTVRLQYERGCGEAGSLLRELIASQTTVARQAAARAEADPPEDTAAPTEAAGPITARPTAPRLPAAAPPPPARTTAATPLPTPHATLSPPARTTAAAPPHATPPPTARTTAAAPPHAAPPPTAQAAPQTPAQAGPAPQQRHDDPAHEDEEARRTTEQFLKFSPVFRAGIAQDRRRDTRPRLTSPTAVAIATLARDRELESCGVLVVHRASVRALMLDVASSVDAGALRWPLLRDAVRTAIEFPRLAARLIPLLVPYLGESAADESSRHAA